MFYFILYAAMGSVIPFLTLFLERRGLSATSIGFLITVNAAAGLVAAPLWGRVADRPGSGRGVLVFALILGIIGSLAAGWAAGLAVIIAGIMVMRVAEDGITPLADGFSVGISRRSGSSWGFGGIRVFGSAGWIAAAPLAGLVAQKSNLSVLFLIYALGLVLCLVILTGLKDFKEKKPYPEEESGGETGGIREILGQISRNKALMGGAAALFIHGLFRQALFRFEPLYLDSLGISLTGIGIAGALPAVAELAAMPISGKLAGKHSYLYLLGGAFLLTAFRAALVWAFPIPWVILSTKMIDGVSYAAQMVGTVSLVSTLVPGGRFKTVLAIFSVSLIHIVTMIGGPAAGWIVDQAGVKPLFILALAGSITGFIILITTRPRRSINSYTMIK
ncbi:MAG: hypothetical protein DRZ90_16645 [Spirochaetes bacterium]|nr:MAG: hypothetical protein DRZ90_16645 [Spirochaetota bacterium]